MRLTKSQRDIFRKMGKRGGKNRAAGMTSKQRTDLARKAVTARWAKARAAAEEVA